MWRRVSPGRGATLSFTGEGLGGMSGLKAKARSAVAVALVALFVFVPAPARADASGWWWLPPAWAALISGALDVGIDVLTGQAENSPIVQGTGFEPTGGDPIDLTNNTFGKNVYTPVLKYFDGAGWPVFTMRWDYCVTGTWPGDERNQNCTEALALDNRYDTVVARESGSDSTSIFTWNASLGGYAFQYGATTESTLLITGFSRGGSSTATVPTRFTRGDPGLSSTTTEIVCRGASGDFTVSETSAVGATIAPSPVCPPGSYPVRITITNSADGVLSDVSITAPDWYLADPSGVEFGFTVDGAICQPGRPGCDELLENPHFWDPTTNGCYARQRNLDLLTSLNVSYPTAIPGPGDGWIRVPDELCLDRPGSDLPISEPVETPDDPDLGVISRGIDRLIEAVRSAGSSVASGVRAVGEKIAGLRSDMNEKLQGLRQDMKEGFDRVVDGIGGIGGDGGDGDGTEHLPGESKTGELLGRAGDALGEPFKDWTDALAAIPAAFTVPASDCMGPAWTIPGGGTHHPFQTCTGDAQKVARVVYVMTGAAVALIGVFAVVRLLGAAIGLQINSGASD